MNRKIMVAGGIILFISTGLATTHTPPDKEDWKNLKVIPKNTNGDQMERIMYQYSKQLGVNCSYCHPDTKPDIFPRRVDFASEELPQKERARAMMRMTDKINKKYFGFKNTYSFESFKDQIVICSTCHRGLPKPTNVKLFYH